MQTEHFKVLNIKCAGCTTNIKNSLTEQNIVNDVEVNIDSGEVIVNGQGLDRHMLTEKLANLGYPEA